MPNILGYLGAAAAMFFFGTAYVPAKIYPTYDGIIFQWFMCSGIISVGFLWGLLTNHWNEVAESGMYLFPEGIIGGSLWAFANLLIPTVVNTIGLGMGFMLWNGVNIVIGYLVGRIGLFGIPPSVPSDPRMSEFGLIVILISIGLFGFVEPEPVAKDCSSGRSTRSPTIESSTPTASQRECQPLLIPHDKSRISHSISLPENSPRLARRSSQFTSIAALLSHDAITYYGPFGASTNISSQSPDDYHNEKSLKTLGIILSLIVGLILGNSLTPYLLWQKKCVPSKPLAPIYVDCNPMNFMFSQCVGIYFTSTIAFVLYSTFHKFAKSKMPRSVIRPAYSSGVLWGLGLGGQLLAAGHLGYSVAYPLTCIGPAVVSMLWSAMYFKEIKGTRNIRFTVTAMTIATVGIILISISA